MSKSNVITPLLIILIQIVGHLVIALVKLEEDVKSLLVIVTTYLIRTFVKWFIQGNFVFG
mgnify:CR=1 FL=1